VTELLNHYLQQRGPKVVGPGALLTPCWP
jgi:hypothetical protein